MLAHQESSWLPAQAFVSILAGYETTANALSFTVYCLSANPDKEACLLREVDAFGDDVPSYQDLESFPYLDAVLRESMRLYPPATSAGREASQDCTLAGQPPMRQARYCVMQHKPHVSMTSNSTRQTVLLEKQNAILLPCMFAEIALCMGLLCLPCFRAASKP